MNFVPSRTELKTLEYCQTTMEILTQTSYQADKKVVCGTREMSISSWKMLINILGGAGGQLGA